MIQNNHIFNDFTHKLLRKPEKIPKVTRNGPASHAGDTVKYRKKLNLKVSMDEVIILQQFDIRHYR